MCKEDIRLARAAVPGKSVSVPTQVGGILAMGANPERYSLMASLDITVDLTLAHGAMVIAVQGSNRWPLIGITNDHPVGVVNLVEVGQLITYDIWVLPLDLADPQAIRVAETTFNRPQDQI